jgi:hypothetical protein
VDSDVIPSADVGGPGPCNGLSLCLAPEQHRLLLIPHIRTSPRSFTIGTLAIHEASTFRMSIRPRLGLYIGAGQHMMRDTHDKMHSLTLITDTTAALRHDDATWASVHLTGRSGEHLSK